MTQLKVRLDLTKRQDPQSLAYPKVQTGPSSYSVCDPAAASASAGISTSHSPGGIPPNELGQSTEQIEKKVDWEQVIKLIHGYQQTRNTEAWLLGTSFNPTVRLHIICELVCSNVYSNICKTYLKKDLGQLESFDDSQALDVARRLYEVHLKSIAQALLEEEKKSQSLQTEIEAIKRGEWDDKLIAEAEKQSSAEVPPVQSPKPSDSHPSPLNPEISENVEENEPDKQSLNDEGCQFKKPCKFLLLFQSTVSESRSLELT
ncbi:hypothetical protein PGT21_013449 [Puccinia graminis f. sp. tritici]|uniref:Uncharacterized protein n=1 Tax=Puccinia graminis f. sp. tritici TaxID=56615 RepID=A0A5B0PRM5_PUCGR|nr:hypothetical protein PGT21_013449 [Puccinia graminis f. sp. tritici]